MGSPIADVHAFLICEGYQKDKVFFRAFCKHILEDPSQVNFYHNGEIMSKYAGVCEGIRSLITACGTLPPLVDVDSVCYSVAVRMVKEPCSAYAVISYCIRKDGGICASTAQLLFNRVVEITSWLDGYDLLEAKFLKSIETLKDSVS